MAWRPGSQPLFTRMIAYSAAESSASSRAAVWLNKSVNIIVVRHGVTQTNIDNIVNGQLDEPLTKEGEKQAKQLVGQLEGRDIEAVYSSPLTRAVATAAPVAQKINEAITIERRLIEVNVGRFEGRPHAEAKKELGLTVRELLNTYTYDFTPYGGESSDEVEARVRSFIDDLRQAPYKTVLIVTHGGIIRWIHYLCTGEKIQAQPNAKVFDLRI